MTDLHEEAHAGAESADHSPGSRTSSWSRRRACASRTRELAERAARIEQLGAAGDLASGQLSPSVMPSCRDGRREAQGLHGNIALLQAQLEASGERIAAR